MMAYLDIPISGISLFSKVSIASEDLPLDNLTRLPSKDVESIQPYKCPRGLGTGTSGIDPCLTFSVWTMKQWTNSAKATCRLFLFKVNRSHKRRHSRIQPRETIF